MVQPHSLGFSSFATGKWVCPFNLCPLLMSGLPCLGLLLPAGLHHLDSSQRWKSKSFEHSRTSSTQRASFLSKTFGLGANWSWWQGLRAAQTPMSLSIQHLKSKPTDAHKKQKKSYEKSTFGVRVRAMFIANDYAGRIKSPKVQDRKP